MSFPLADAEMRALAEAFSAAGVPSITSAAPAALRALFASIRPPESIPMSEVRDELIVGGDRSITVRRYVPEVASPTTVLYFHGGGWTVGSIDDYDHYLRRFARATGCTVLSAEYRLAPEHPFPAAVEDAWDVFRTVSASEASLAVAGDSAGANLAAVVAQMAAAAGGPEPVAQILLYPMVDGDVERPSLFAFEPPILSRAEIAAFVDHYCPDYARRSDPRFSPINASNLQGLPPALIVTAEADLLAEQADDYARRLRDAGVAVECHRQPSAVHGYLSLAPDSQAAAATLERIGIFIAGLEGAARG